jgi:hypothetical protein
MRLVQADGEVSQVRWMREICTSSVMRAGQPAVSPAPATLPSLRDTLMDEESFGPPSHWHPSSAHRAGHPPRNHTKTGC